MDRADQDQRKFAAESAKIIHGLHRSVTTGRYLLSPQATQRVEEARQNLAAQEHESPSK